jgi:hypothetical protein
MLRKVLGPERDEVTGSRIKWHDEELHNLYPSPNNVRVIKSWRMRWAGHIMCMGEVRTAHKILVGKPKGKRPCRSPRHTWEDDIKMDLIEILWEGMDWINLA